MLAHGAEFAGHAATGPQKLDTMMGTTFWTKAFRRFFLETDGLNAFNLLFGVDRSRFCFHCPFSLSALGMKGDSWAVLPDKPQWNLIRITT